MSGPSRRNLIAGAGAVLTLPRMGIAAPATARELEARPATLPLLSGATKTPLLTFDGANPGPLLRYRQGETLTLDLVNRIERPMSLHLHGMRGDNAMDGVVPLTQKAVEPGARFEYRRVLRDPGLFLYRPSVFPATRELMGRGLKGLLVVDEQTPLDADADVILALDAMRLDAAGKLDLEGSGEETLLVNGAKEPFRLDAAPGARVRLRFANVASAKLMALTFEGAQPFIIAIDSQPCDAFEPVRRTTPAAPGSRFEMMFDMPAREGEAARLFLRGGDGATADVFVATAKGKPAPARKPIAALPENPLLPREIKLAQSRKFDLVVERRAEDRQGSWTLNGAVSQAYSGPPLFRVARGTPVTIGFVNRAGRPIVMHVHGHAVRLLHDLDDGWEPYWRNGVVVPPGKTKHVAFLADSPGAWALHDDILEHEATGLASWFEVS